MTLLQPFITQRFNGTIWRLEIDSLTGTLVAEIRDEAEKQTSFASVSIHTGDINFAGYKTPERWLTGIECVYDNMILLHHYRHESGPEHKGIIAINAVTAADAWSNYSLTFDHLTINGPAVHDPNIQPKKLLLIDIKSGHIKRAYDTGTDKSTENEITLPDAVSAAHFPPGSLPEEPCGNIVHHHDHNRIRIVSLHTLKNGLLQQHLFIMSGADIIYRDLLNTGIQKLQPEAFVLHKNALIYIKNRNEINILNL